tara:strand:+ start:148 stop:384 length:237 start_codon:yes stop_codon:yes gene_type:complete
MEDEDMYNKRIEDLELKVAELEKKIEEIIGDNEEIYRIGANLSKLYAMIRDTGQYIADKEGVALLDVADFTIDRKRIL